MRKTELGLKLWRGHRKTDAVDIIDQHANGQEPTDGPAATRYRAQGVNPKATMLEFIATAIYCRPSTAYVIGEACQRALSGKCQSRLPVLASSAPNEPSSSPKNTNPPAVANSPLQVSPEPVCSYSHTIFPVWGSMARKYLRGISAVTGRAEPP